MNPLIKWPGGKAGEIDKIVDIIPKFDRYIEPFVGGGAMFFFLKPKSAIINDISGSLVEFYNLIKNQDRALYDLLLCYNNSFSNLINICKNRYDDILKIYDGYEKKEIDKKQLFSEIKTLTDDLIVEINHGFNENLVLDECEFLEYLNKMVSDKIIRTVKNNEKSKYDDADLKENIITGFTSGYYMYFRKIFNDINLNRTDTPSLQYKVANFYFIREYCYGSMFRYNACGEFNIPYGGMSYNKKNLKSKIDNMFSEDVKKVFENTSIHCSDFEGFIETAQVSENDFMFLDPPYDTEFSSYEGMEFTRNDQERLASVLRRIQANFILIIKNTEFIRNLYEHNFVVRQFDKEYTYNVRSRNDRSVEHLIVTNITA